MSDLKAFNVMAKAIATLPPETRLEILDALQEDLEFIKKLAEQSNLNYLAYGKKVVRAVSASNRRKNHDGKNFTRWDMHSAHLQGAYQSQRDMQYGIQNIIVEAKRTLQAESAERSTGVQS